MSNNLTKQLHEELAQKNSFKVLEKLVKILRSKDGCPWDRKQTPTTMSRYLAEEVYEVLDAIVRNDADAVCEELGDVLFHLFFITHLYAQKRHFTMETVVKKIVTKMIRRHPHVFDNITVKDVDAVSHQWAHIKQAEGKNNEDASRLDGVPVSLPAMLKAYQISSKAAAADFDWDHIDAVVAQAEAEFEELKQELRGASHDPDPTRRRMLELGDLLFTLVNVARFMGVHPEIALAEATHKFEKRFRRMETTAQIQGGGFDRLSRDEKEALWKEVKSLGSPDVESK